MKVFDLEFEKGLTLIDDVLPFDVMRNTYLLAANALLNEAD